MVEATIALPVLILLLIGATYLRELYLARAATRLTARSCAWAYAMKGCRGAKPEGCNAPVREAHEEAPPDIAEKTRLRVGNASDPFRDVPVVREALAGLFGEATHAEASATVPFPFDDTRVGVARAEAVVVCNSTRTKLLDIAEELLCDHLPCR